METVVRNAGRFMAEAACDAIKLEGGAEMADRIAAIAASGIPPIGHLGLKGNRSTRPFSGDRSYLEIEAIHDSFVESSL
ncbi:MAG: 3-methyl-2-oxobutanoate hydroxymethyltransferase [Anaerolineae bacterium]